MPFRDVDLLMEQVANWDTGVPVITETRCEPVPLATTQDCSTGVAG